jgi:thiol-disulfide isomerase/thioredoxin
MNDNIENRFARFAGLVLIGGAWLLSSSARGDDPPKSLPAGPTLNLADGGVVPGKLVDFEQPGMVRWQSEFFSSPFEFPRDEVLSIRFPVAEKPLRAAGAYGFELSAGDVLYGSLVELDDKIADLDVAGLGRVRVDRGRIQRVFRWRDGADLLSDGPNGLVGWREVAPPKALPDRPVRALAMGGGVVINGNINGPAPVKPKPVPIGPGWVEDGRQLRAARDGVTIQSNIGLPLRSSIELELSWKQSPDFLLALGVSDDEKTVARAFRLEVWDKQIVAVRETDKEAEVVTIQPAPDGPGRVHLQIFLDQELGKLAVYSESGALLAELKLGSEPAPGLPGVRLTNIRGDLRLDRLRVARWDGETAHPAGLGGSLVRLTDRSVVQGKVERFDPTSREFVIRGESGESRVAEDRIGAIAFPSTVDDLPRSVRAAFQDGTQLAGAWTSVGGGKIFLKVHGFADPVQIPQEGLRSLDVLPRNQRTRDLHALSGTLEMDGLRVLGYLVPSGGRPGEAGLAWQPLAGGTPSTFKPGVSGRIVYRRTPDQPKAAAAYGPPPQMNAGVAVRKNANVAVAPVNAGVAMGMNVNVAIAGRVNGVAATFNPPPEALMPPVRRSLYLRSGDIIPVEVSKITEEGVFFRTKFSENNFVSNDRVKAVELAPEDPSSIRVNQAKFERLLTLPRMQKDNPPKHMIRSTNGDILRGNLISMDDKTIGIEVRLEEKVIPRDRISRIIWLHADETDPTKKPSEPLKAESGTRVQAVLSDGIRLTFNAERFADGTLLGRSDVLGDCKVKVEDLDQLLIGGSVEKEATQVAYQNFKLQLAAEPKSALFERGETPEGGAMGTESPMVGKDAPDFQLDLLGGKKFHLAENKGQVIVLDFWATWCGPCIQAMPQIDKVIHEFADKGVKLIAVNLQETPAKITAMLERLKLSPTVVLDKDGVVAAKYGASAIPQTVVIDQQGKVTRLFIGGGPHLGDELRQALQALMPPDPKP